MGREEMPAEMGSAFLSLLCRVETPDTEENAAAYVVKAAQDAEKTVDFLTASLPAGLSSRIRSYYGKTE